MKVVLAVVDTAAVIFAAILVYICLFGGFVLSIPGFELKFRTPARAAFWLAGLLVVRRLLFRGSPRAGLAAVLPAWPSENDPLPEAYAPGVARRAVFAGIGIAVAIVVVFHDVVLHPYSAHDYGDPLFSIWRMGWVLHQLATDPAHLFDANIFYPERLTLTLSDPMILPALMQAPLLASGVHPVLAYTLLFLSAVWVSGVAMYLLVERLTGAPPAAFIAAVMFACYPYRVEHVSHLELQMMQWMPLGLLALHLFIGTGRWRWVLLLAAALVAQLYSSMYYALYFVIYLMVVGIGLLVVLRPPIRRLALPTATAALVAVMAAVPLMLAFAAAQPMKGDRPIEEVEYYSADFVDYLRPTRFSVWWADILPEGKPERALFPGAAPVALAAIGMAPPFSGVRVVYAAGLALALDASRGPKGAIYPYFYKWFPPLRGIRAPARFGAIVGLSLSILAAYGARRLLRRPRSETAKHVLAAAMAAAVVVDGLSKLDEIVPIWTEPPSIYDGLENTPRVVLAEFPVGDAYPYSVVFQYFSMWHWKPMVGGYSGFAPKSYERIWFDLQQFPREDSIEVLRLQGVTHVTVNCGLYYAKAFDCDATARLMAASPELRLLKEARWQGGLVRLYEVRR